MRTVILSAGFAAGLACGIGATRLGAQPARELACGAASTPQVRTTLYFGTSRPQGFVSELEWQLFLRDEVTSRFPDGLTAWDAYGQWRGPSGSIDHDRAKVLLIVHADTAAARERVQAVIAQYRKMFDQQSVLWETARVCAAL
jgi:hypothetical protein